MKKIFLFCFLSVLAFSLKGQKINITLPGDANKSYVFLLNKGIKQDTIQKGNISFTGEIVVHIPDKDKGYIGMGTLHIKDKSPLNIIIDDNDFSVKQGADGKYKFTNSPENSYLYSIMQEQVFPEDNTDLYASYFVNIIRYMQSLNKAVQGISLKEKADVRAYALENLDMEKLYTSSVWHDVIDGLVRLNPGQQGMAQDMVTLLKRVKSQEVFEHLADNLIMITEQFGWDDAFDIIVPYIEESGRIEVPQGNMFTAFALAKVRKGMIAPDIKGLKPSLKESKALKTLLVFYQPDCDNCHTQLEKLIKVYPELNQKGVRVVSISSDHLKESFEKDKRWFPWPDSDKLCDFEGFSGTNYLNYGIMATPTFFLLDKEQKVIKRYALVSDIEFFEKN